MDGFERAYKAMNQDGGRRLPGLLPGFSFGKSAGAGKEALGVRVGLTGFKPNCCP
jgi:hypothetical protein